jgi:hypothetical protein
MPIGISNEIADALGRAAPVEPEWLRVPDAARFAGSSPRVIQHLVTTRRIKSRLLKADPANERGIRIIYLPSLRAYIESCPE